MAVALPANVPSSPEVRPDAILPMLRPNAAGVWAESRQSTQSGQCRKSRPHEDGFLTGAHVRREAGEKDTDARGVGGSGGADADHRACIFDSALGRLGVNRIRVSTTYNTAPTIGRSAAKYTAVRSRLREAIGIVPRKATPFRETQRRLSPVYRAVAGNPEHLRPHAPDGRMLRAPSEPQITLQDAAQPRLIWLCIIFHWVVSHG